MLYGTTKEFLEFFALAIPASLPTLREFHESLRGVPRDRGEAARGAGRRHLGIVADLADEKLRADPEAKRAESDAALEGASSGRWRRPTRRLRPHRPRST